MEISVHIDNQPFKVINKQPARSKAVKIIAMRYLGKIKIEGKQGCSHAAPLFINRSTCQAYIETLKMPLTHKQAKSGGQTNIQTNQTLYPCRAWVTNNVLYP